MLTHPATIGDRAVEPAPAGARAPVGPVDAAEKIPEPRRLTPEERAVLGLARWPYPVEEVRLWLLTNCPRCGLGGIALDPPHAPGQDLFLVNWRTCYDGLGCPAPAIREALEAVRAGSPVPVDGGDLRRLARYLGRGCLAHFWSPRPGRHPWRTLWALRCSLEDEGLAPQLVASAVRALARRHGWPDALAIGVLRRERF